jgi:hypothetical protein
MNLQSAVELILALGALSLLVRDLRRAWRDALRRPVTLFAAALFAILLIGSFGGRPHPHPWWLALPAAVLAWEAVRGWRRTPRCHQWEAGIGAFGAGGVLAVATAATLLGICLLWRSHTREPHPWRDDDAARYERRSTRRPKT